MRPVISQLYSLLSKFSSIHRSKEQYTRTVSRESRTNTTNNFIRGARMSRNVRVLTYMRVFRSALQKVRDMGKYTYLIHALPIM